MDVNGELIQVGFISHAVTQDAICQTEYPMVACNIQNGDILDFIDAEIALDVQGTVKKEDL